MAYFSVDQRDQDHYWNTVPPHNDPNAFELKSNAPSISSAQTSFVGHGAQGDVASDHHHLLHSSLKGDPRRKWSPGFWKQLPILGILSLLGVLASTLATLAILVRSHRKPLDDWGYGIAPSVYLAIASVIANALSAYALAIGLEITFWRNALKGRTLAELNQNWLNGQNLWHAIFQGYRVGGRLTALACIFSVLALLRGPLNQRASEVQSDVAYNTSGEFDLSLAQILPDNYTGLARYSRTRVREIARLTPTFSKIMQEHSMRSNISIEHKACGVSCSATVKGFGFKSQCRKEEFISDRQFDGAWTQTYFNSSTQLYPISNLSRDTFYYEDMGIRLNVTYLITLSDEDKATRPKNITRMRLRSHICDLTGATVEYNVILNSQTVTSVGDRVVKDLIMPGPGSFHHSTIGGFQYAASYLFSSTAVYNFGGAVSDLTLSGALANEMLKSEQSWNETFSDPMDSMIGSMQQIAFRTSVRAGRDLTNSTNANQTVQYQGVARYSVYVTDFRYMAAALVLSIASFVTTGLTFYGWWQLGRTVSLSPLEIAKAFDAPLLAHVGSNIHLSHNANLGSSAAVKVQYGEKLGEQVYTTGYNGGGVEPQTQKLVMGLAGHVRRPNPRENYGT